MRQWLLSTTPAEPTARLHDFTSCISSQLPKLLLLKHIVDLACFETCFAAHVGHAIFEPIYTCSRPWNPIHLLLNSIR